MQNTQPEDAGYIKIRMTGFLFLMYYSMFAMGWSSLSVILSKIYPWDYYDDLLCVLIPPVLYATQFYGRKIFLSCSIVAYGCAFVADFLLLEQSYETLVTVTFIIGSIIIAQEIIYRSVEKERRLSQQNLALTEELERTLETIKRLGELLPICDICNKLRTDEKIWCDFEEFLQKELKTKTHHGICEECEKSITALDDAV